MTNPPGQPSPNQPFSEVVDISNELKQIGTGTIKYESSEERASRLKNEEHDANHRRWRGTMFSVATIIALVYVFALCVQIISSPNATPDEKKWATTIITSIVSGGIGFIVGKGSA